MVTVTPFLWFDSNADDAVDFYLAIFPDSRRTGGAKGPDGRALTVAFELDGQPFTALNGGPQFAFTEAVSFEIDCADQVELDYYWDRLTEGGDPEAQQCGWLKDRWGVSWQITPRRLMEMMKSPDRAASRRASEAMMTMIKLDIAALEKAFKGA